ncbi:hypothetical protein EV644_10776 [Kribbella orskensis]|uniref:Secreted protein n=1 Tax=Kribbella orskensis TaxID=2512216 RepID=A0ABY2BIU4_9ACTN|nr:MULTISPECIES: hypothetical protein [Kribbella]TCN39107.1 hypothetical protein EV642_10776 [Kribbella sp. VKM Ac-2500]TCO21754.1 hypothetical protein EV644_10776 [Kribbella orskensis]
MLTPRHQALLATLAGMTVGVAVFGTVLAINNASSPDTSADTVRTSPTPTPKPSATDGLQPGSLQFTTASFGSDKAPITSEVPTGWKSTQGGLRPRYADPTGVWQIRFDARGSKQSPDKQVDARARSIDEQDLKVISRDGGTLIYTYVDKTRGPRMGLSRWLPADDGKRSAIEITVGGRPQDEAGLRAVLDHATDTLQLPTNNDNRPS